MRTRVGLLARTTGTLLVVAVLAGAFSGVPAGAQEGPDPLIADSLAALSQLVSPENCDRRDAADGNVDNGIQMLYVFCDDGLPASGGGEGGIPVPVKYHATESGNDWTGLPLPASVEEVAQAAEDDLRPDGDNRITLDVDISLPPSGASVLFPEEEPVGVPLSGQPVIVFMHGCCGGNKTSWEANSIDGTNELWHHSNAWFAARGYVVITYTARGFRNSNDQGSTGTTQLDSRRYEINDYQYLTGLLADHDAARRAEGTSPVFSVNPRKIGAVGGSYGGGFTWLALTDPTWRAPASRRRMKLAAAVPKYGWTDLVEALVPSGHYLDRTITGETKIAPTDSKKALSRSPLGVEKQSIVSGLYASGNLASGNHTTFPQYLHDVFARLQAGEPYDGDPTLEAIADTFLNDRSAYFQTQFWRAVSRGLKVPVFAAATWTDPLFPTIESLRFYNKLKRVSPRYPIAMYLGDYQHFVANKPKEWGDLCGADNHVCTIDDFKSPSGALNLNRARTRKRIGINTRINRFLDHFLRGRGDRPVMNVTSTTTICAANATEKYKVDEPGIEYRAGTWRALSGAKPIRLGWGGGGALNTTTSTAALDQHADQSDPVVRDRQADKCFSTTQTNPGPGVVQVISEEIKKAFTMTGLPLVTTKHETAASDYWIAARMFDLDADGNMTMVTRGVCRVNLTTSEDKDCATFALFGNAWRFDKGHKVVLELSQADTPFLRRNNMPSTIAFPDIQLTIPRASSRFKNDFRG
jgi:predicted acyl esterase